MIQVATYNQVLTRLVNQERIFWTFKSTPGFNSSCLTGIIVGFSKQKHNNYLATLLSILFVLQMRQDLLCDRDPRTKGLTFKALRTRKQPLSICVPLLCKARPTPARGQQEGFLRRWPWAVTTTGKTKCAEYLLRVWPWAFPPILSVGASHRP